MQFDELLDLWLNMDELSDSDREDLLLSIDPDTQQYLDWLIDSGAVDP
jgi:hypothetical protein